MSARPPFDFSAPFVARSSFLYDGKSFRDGHAFPWRDLKVPPLTLWNLWSAYLIENGSAQPQASAKTAPVDRRTAQAPSTPSKVQLHPNRR